MGKKLVVLGSGISGLGSVNLAYRKGFEVFVSADMTGWEMECGCLTRPIVDQFCPPP